MQWGILLVKQQQNTITFVRQVICTWVFPKIVVPQNGWGENPPFLETPIYQGCLPGSILIEQTSSEQPPSIHLQETEFTCLVWTKTVISWLHRWKHKDQIGAFLEDLPPFFFCVFFWRLWFLHIFLHRFGGVTSQHAHSMTQALERVSGSFHQHCDNPPMDNLQSRRVPKRTQSPKAKYVLFGIWNNQHLY